MADYRACPKCGDPGYVTVTGEHLCGNVGCDHAEPLGVGYESDEHRLRRQLAGAVEALRRIKDEEGKVCDQFEVCDHRACNSSYAAWAIADEYLGGDR
jgi:hypothetical protein